MSVEAGNIDVGTGADGELVVGGNGELVHDGVSTAVDGVLVVCCLVLSFVGDGCVGLVAVQKAGLQFRWMPNTWSGPFRRS